MPSEAYKTFLNQNILDVQYLIEAHGKMGGNEPGKKALAHITKSAILMLCAAWEMYIEDVLIECVDELQERLKSADKLPVNSKKFICKEIENLNKKNELAALQLTGDGWKTIFKDATIREVGALNTPKPVKIDELFHKILGKSDLSSEWKIPSELIAKFVSTRGEIAHKGASAKYIQKPEVENWLRIIKFVAIETDRALLQFLKDSIPSDPDVKKIKQQIWQIQYASDDMTEISKIVKKLETPSKPITGEI